MPDVVSCIFSWNSLDRSALGVLGAGQHLAKQAGGKHCVLCVGTFTQDTLSTLQKFADALNIADHPLLVRYHSETTLTALAQACGSLKPVAVVLGNDTYSQELTPRLAHRLKGSAAGDALTLNIEDGTVLTTRPV